MNRNPLDHQRTKKWRVLVIDDDPDILLLTSALLAEVTFDDQEIELSTARSGQYARKLLAEDQDFAIAIIDVAMETERAGLELIEFIRFELKNKLMRIILRTAKADQEPAWETVCRYEIDAYVDKSEATADRFLTSVATTLRCFQSLQQLANQQRHSLGGSDVLAITQLLREVQSSNERVAAECSRIITSINAIADNTEPY